MKIAADTNVLVRAITGDNARQSRIARAELENAETVVLAVTALCELVWVLSQGYKIPAAEISQAIRRLINAENVVVNRPAAEAGLDILDAGGDFADGIIAFEGRWGGADAFVSFDKRAVKIVASSGAAARPLS